MLLPYKDDNPTRTFPFITLTIIAANISVFLYQTFLLNVQQEHDFILKMGLIPYEITHLKDVISNTPIPLYLTPFTSFFMHGGLLHVGGNMLYLWIFGDNIEDALGHFRFIFFYLMCGILATSAHIISNPNSEIPLVGASGAIAGVLGAYLVNFPSARIRVFVFFFFFINTIRIPAFIVLGIWFLMQLLNATAASGGIGSGVAWFAHIGGFVAGVILILRWGGRRLRTPRANW